MGDLLYQTAVRAFFRKEGRVKYISHLDLVRCVSRALKRSGLPVWHTLGFNPHIYTTFALPLALGYESRCESMDFRLVEDRPMEEVQERLNEVLPSGIQVYQAKPPKMKPESIAWADYDIVMEVDSLSGEGLLEKFQEWLSQPQLITMKRGKKGEKAIDLKPHLQVWNLQANPSQLRMTMRTAAGTSLNINPTLALDAFALQGGEKADWLSVTRTAILTKELEPFE